MTHSRVAVSDDHVSLFLISGELTKQCLALGRIEMDRCFLGTGRSLVFGFEAPVAVGEGRAFRAFERTVCFCPPFSCL